MDRFPDIDLAALPVPKLIKPLDFEEILSSWKSDFTTRYPEAAKVLDLASEPLVKLMETGAYRELLLRQRVNEAARGVMLAYATGSDLDQLAALTPVSRLQLTKGDPDAMPPVPPTFESDAAFRRRIRMAPKGFSVAGPAAAYRFHGMSVPGVRDISVTSPGPCRVNVAVLGTDGVPSDTLVQQVRSLLEDHNIRPLTDHVSVGAAEPVLYKISATLYFGAGPDPKVALEAAKKALDAYIDRCGMLSVGVALSGIHAALHQPGVQRVVLTSPDADVPAKPHQFAVLECKPSLEVG